MSAADKKTPSVLHFYLFFLVPVLVFVGWAGYRLVDSLLHPQHKTAIEILDEMKAARSSGDRWQIGYQLSQEIQRRIHSGEIQSWSPAEKDRFFAGLFEMVRSHLTDQRMKKYFLVMVGQIGDPAGIALCDELSMDRDDEVRFYAAWGLIDYMSKHPAEVTADRLTKARQWLWASDVSLRKVAATFLIQYLHTRKNLPRNESVSREQGHEKAETSPALIPLSESEERSIWAELRQQLQDADHEVRWNTAAALAAIGDSEGAHELSKLFDLRAIRAMEFSSTKDLERFLLAVSDSVQKSKNAELRRLALEFRNNVANSTPEGRAVHRGLGAL